MRCVSYGQIGLSEIVEDKIKILQMQEIPNKECWKYSLCQERGLTFQVNDFSSDVTNLVRLQAVLR